MRLPGARGGRRQLPARLRRRPRRPPSPSFVCSLSLAAALSSSGQSLLAFPSAIGMFGFSVFLLLSLPPDPFFSPTSSRSLPLYLRTACQLPCQPQPPTPVTHHSIVGGRGRRRRAGAFGSGKRCGGRTRFYGFFHVAMGLERPLTCQRRHVGVEAGHVSDDHLGCLSRRDAPYARKTLDNRRKIGRSALAGADSAIGTVGLGEDTVCR